ncbi:MAG: transcription termination/antitermination NusG family protein [Armatimonadota bacterium]|nr:transcription termination/antitermination NusG family protein [Armatimonadota bacterium]
MTDLAWYAVQTKPREEERVIHRLRDRPGLSIFLPRIEVRRKRHSRRITVVEPLFPSYVFVNMRLEPEPWYAVKWTPGVKRIVGTGETPTPVPPEAIDLLVARCGNGEVIQWRSGMREGDTVRVKHGPFAGLEGILERPTSRGERVRVLLRLLGTTTAVEMDVADIERVA